MEEKSLPVVCLMGPTAVGKTQLAIQLAQQFSVDIISVDSAMVYRGFDIGTAKPTPAERQLAPHALLDICDPTDVYSAGRFYEEVLPLIRHSHAQQKIPLLVGGTLLYFYVLQKGFSKLPKANSDFRKKVEEQSKGETALYEELLAKDPLSAQKIHCQDKQRIQRALEVWHLTGKSLVLLQKTHRLPALPYRFINVMLVPESRQALQGPIRSRLDKMIQTGFLEEVKTLYNRSDLSPEFPAVKLVGYRQLWGYFQGAVSYERAYEETLRATQSLVKRQMTWLKRWNMEDSTWFISTQETSRRVSTFLKNFLNL